jgi:hypothetical protein
VRSRFLAPEWFDAVRAVHSAMLRPVPGASLTHQIILIDDGPSSDMAWIDNFVDGRLEKFGVTGSLDRPSVTLTIPRAVYVAGFQGELSREEAIRSTIIQGDLEALQSFAPRREYPDFRSDASTSERGHKVLNIEPELNTRS